MEIRDWGNIRKRAPEGEQPKYSSLDSKMGRYEISLPSLKDKIQIDKRMAEHLSAQIRRDYSHNTPYFTAAADEHGYAMARFLAQYAAQGSH